MPKTKGGPALFDLLDPNQDEHDGGSLPVTPGSDRNRDAGPAGGDDLQTEMHHPRDVGNDQDAPHPPLVELDGRYVRLALTSVSAAVVVFALVAALVAAYKTGVGRGFVAGQAVGFAEGEASVAADAQDEIEATRNQPPNTAAIESLLLEDAVGEAADPTMTAARIDGYTYIIVQEFVTSARANAEADANVAQAYLRHQGIETVKVYLANGAIQLVTEQGYNHGDDAQREMGMRLLDRVREVGAAYYAGRHGYKLEGYFWKYRSDQE